MKIYWGDIHNHCAVSYGYGTPERVLDNARQHLDFCSITGHAFWPDMPLDIKQQNNMLVMHFGGFQKLQYFWKELTEKLESANKPGKFVTFSSYEWHSMKYGDYNVYFNSGNAPLLDAPTLPELIKKTRKYQALLLPHHCAYLPGFRGTRWRDFDDAVSPLVEIFSNHGCCESDDAYFDYYHTMGPRVKDTSVREGLLKGHKFGFYASTDTHDGYPGHYGHGQVGVITDKLDRKSIWEAMLKKRTIASTGTHFDAKVYLENSFIGETVKTSPEMNLKVNLSGTAPLKTVEIVEGSGQNVKIHRLPMNALCSAFVPGRHKVKIECGWGRNGNIKDWNFDIAVKNGKLLSAIPFYRFSSYEMDEEKSTEKMRVSKNKIHWECRTKPSPSGLIGGTHFDAGGTQAVILEIDALKNTEIELKCKNLSMKIPVSNLVKGSMGKAIGGFCSPAVKIHRAIQEKEYAFDYEGKFIPSRNKGFIYVRASQTDGQTAWISPIWHE